MEIGYELTVLWNKIVRQVMFENLIAAFNGLQLTIVLFHSQQQSILWGSYDDYSDIIIKPWI